MNKSAKPRVQRLSNGVGDEPDLPKLPDMDDVAAIEEK
jgi:hypothetical protein